MELLQKAFWQLQSTTNLLKNNKTMITYKKFNLSEHKNHFVVTDETLQKLYNINGENVFVLPKGEEAKSFEVAKNLCLWLLHKQCNKDSTIVAVGGGSVGDLVGFCASIFMRGIKLLHIPTTLLAMIDSSIGGKTAIDLGGVKNVVGTIYVADTLIDFDFLETLPQEQMEDANGEIEKYKLLSSDIGATDIQTLIKQCIEFKSKIVEKDLLDKNIRRQLNLGHTVAHALELSYNLTHGQAVLLGLYYELKLAEKIGLLETGFAKNFSQKNNLTEKLQEFKLSAEILNKTLHDKKNSNGKVAFVLYTKDGIEEKLIDKIQLEKLLL